MAGKIISMQCAPEPSDPSGINQSVLQRIAVFNKYPLQPNVYMMTAVQAQRAATKRGNQVYLAHVSLQNVLETTSGI